MGILDTILRLFFRKTLDTYDEIVESHREAYQSWLITPSGLALNGGYGKPSFLDKRYVVAHKEEILRLESLLRRLQVAHIMDEPMSGAKELPASGRSILALERSEYEELYAHIGSLPEEDERETGKKAEPSGKKTPKGKQAKESREREIERRYSELQKKYPKGLPAYEAYYSYDDGKNSAGPTIGEIVEQEEEIARFEEIAGEKERHEAWIKKQEEYAAYCRDLRDELADEWGCYIYKLSFPAPSYGSETNSSSYPFWQLFCESCSADSSLDYSLMPKKKLWYEKYRPELLDKTRHFKTTVYDKVVLLASRIKERYGNVLVLFGDSGVKDDSFNSYHLSYLKSKLSERTISFDYAWVDPVLPFLYKYVLLVNVTETNEHMMEDCRRIIARFGEEYPHIVCVTLLKEFSSEEMLSLIKRNEDERNAALEKEEKARREEVRENLFRCVSSWQRPTRSSVRCFSLYNYYPTNCEWDANDAEWAIRNLIWDFKASPNKPMTSFEVKLRHERTLRRIVPDIEKVIQYYFKELAHELTFVCIPSSKRVVTERRYQDFFQMVCDSLGMANAFSHVHVVRDGEAKRLGGTVRAEISLDNDYFMGRYALIFDDVITSGSSMERMSSLLKAAGATVIAGISIGRTKHQREPHNPIETLALGWQERGEGGDLDDDLPF